MSPRKAIVAMVLPLAMTLSGCLAAGGPVAHPTPRPPHITAFPLPLLHGGGRGSFDLQAGSIISGPDGNMWFTAGGINPDSMEPIEEGAIGRITPAGKMTWFDGPSAQYTAPNSITVGSDGNLWYTESGVLPVGFGCCATLGRITPAGAIHEFPIDLPQFASFNITVGDIAAGPNGKLWFTIQVANNYSAHGPALAGAVGEMSTAGVLNSFLLPGANIEIDAGTLGPDGNFWCAVTHIGSPSGQPTQILGSKIERITPTGVMTGFPLPDTTGFPSAMATGPDGNLWVVMTLPPTYSTSELLRVTPTGSVTRFPVLGGNGQIDGLAAGPDGNLWFTHNTDQPGSPDMHVNQLARMSMSGTLTEFPLGVSTRRPAGLTIGPDHALWFVADDAIGRIG